MEKLTRRRYTLEYKQEAVRLVSSGQTVAAAAKALGIVEQTLANWVKVIGLFILVPVEMLVFDQI